MSTVPSTGLTVPSGPKSMNKARLRLYADSMSERLAAHVNEMTDESVPEQFQLLTEVALARHAARHAVKLYDVALIAYERGQLKPESLLEAAAVMKASLRDVAEVVDVASKIDERAREKVSLATVHRYVEQVTRLACQCFGSDTLGLAMAEQFDKLVKLHVRLPSLSADDVSGQGGRGGTDVTPDVLEMDRLTVGGPPRDDTEPEEPYSPGGPDAVQSFTDDEAMQ